MSSVSKRKRADGSIAYKAEIVVRKDGVRHKLSQTFDRETAARHWIARREEEVRKSGGLAKPERTRTAGLQGRRRAAQDGQFHRPDAEVIAATVAGMPDSLGGICMAIGVAELARP